LLRLQILNVDGALLRGQPALADQRAVTIPGHFCKFAVGLRLLQRRLQLTQRGLGLRDLVVEFGSDDLRQQLSRLHLVADVDFALGDIAAGAGEDICSRERRRGGGQTDDLDAVAGLYRCHADLRDEIVALLRGGDHLSVLLIVAPCPESQRCH